MSYNEIAAVKFLTKLFKNGIGYSSINTARSALSTILTNEHGLTIGNCSSVKRLMKGIFELKPPAVKYKFIWDTNIVLNFLSLFYPLEDIPLSFLTYKLCMLMAISTMQRVQTLHSIEIDDIFISKNCVKIPIRKLLKQSNQRNYDFSLYLKFFDNPAICVARTLSEYLTRTKPIRGSIKQLFISFQKPSAKIR